MAGLTAIEATAFVSPKWVPQMADHAEVLARIRRHAGVAYPVLVPNLKGLEAALAAGAEEVAVFGAASESFSRQEHQLLHRREPGAVPAGDRGGASGTTSPCAATCRASWVAPTRATIRPDAVAAVAQRSVRDGLLRGLARRHDRRRNARADEGPARDGREARPGRAARRPLPRHLRSGAREHLRVARDGRVACSTAPSAGLGGCPYAKGATGNVATEDLVYLLDGLGIETGVDLDRLIDAGEFISAALGRVSNSRVARAVLAKRSPIS